MAARESLLRLLAVALLFVSSTTAFVCRQASLSVRRHRGAVWRGGWGLLAMSQQEQELQLTIRKMKAAEIKKALTDLGVSTAGIIDKDDLVKLLVSRRLEGGAASGASQTGDSSRAAGGRRSYATAKAPFRQKTPPSKLPGGGSSDSMAGPKSYICVDLTIQGQKLEFLVDSGATPTIVTEATRQRLGLQPLAGGLRLEGVAAGGAAAAPRVMMYDVCLAGDRRCSVNMDALVMGSAGVLPSGVDGLLGIKYLQYFGIVDFDFRSMTLAVYPYDARDEKGSTRLEDLLDDLEPEMGLMQRGIPMRQDPQSAIFFVDLQLEKDTPPVPSIVDLGAGMSLINWKAAEQAGLQRDSPRVIKDHMKVWGIDGTTVPVDLADFGQPRVGPVLISRRRYGISDLPAFRLIGFGDKPCGVLGMDVLGGKRIVFDFRSNMLYIA